MWVPDVYQGSPTSVTLFISSAPKVAAFAMAIRLLVDGMAGLVANSRALDETARNESSDFLPSNGTQVLRVSDLKIT